MYYFTCKKKNDKKVNVLVIAECHSEDLKRLPDKQQWQITCINKPGFYLSVIPTYSQHVQAANKNTQ